MAGMSLAGLFAGDTVTSPFHLLKPSSSFMTHPSAWCREEKCATHQKQNRGSHMGERDSPKTDPLRTESEAGMCTGTPREPGQEPFQSTEIQGPEQPLSITQDAHGKLMFT